MLLLRGKTKHCYTYDMYIFIIIQNIYLHIQDEAEAEKMLAELKKSVNGVISDGRKKRSFAEVRYACLSACLCVSACLSVSVCVSACLSVCACACMYKVYVLCVCMADST